LGAERLPDQLQQRRLARAGSAGQDDSPSIVGAAALAAYHRNPPVPHVASAACAVDAARQIDTMNDPSYRPGRQLRTPSCRGPSAVTSIGGGTTSLHERYAPFQIRCVRAPMSNGLAVPTRPTSPPGPTRSADGVIPSGSACRFGLRTSRRVPVDQNTSRSPARTVTPVSVHSRLTSTVTSTRGTVVGRVGGAGVGIAHAALTALRLAMTAPIKPARRVITTKSWSKHRIAILRRRHRIDRFAGPSRPRRGEFQSICH
jgi:hypothetical protein